MMVKGAGGLDVSLAATLLQDAAALATGITLPSPAGNLEECGVEGRDAMVAAAVLLLCGLIEAVQA